MALFSEEFAGWRDGDFAAFAPAKWRSNRFTPERTRVRLRLAAALEQAAARAGLETVGLHLWSSRQEPALTNQHEVRALTVAWTRPDAEDVAESEPYVGLMVEESTVTLQLRIPARLSPAWQVMAPTLAELAVLAGMQMRLAGVDVQAEAVVTSREEAELRLERVMSREDALGGLLTVDELAAWSGVVLPLLAQLLGTVLASVPVPTLPEVTLPSPEVVPSADSELHFAEVTFADPGESAPALPAAHLPAANLRDPPPRRGYRPQWTPPTAARAGAPDGQRPPIERILPPTWRPEPPRPPPRPEPIRPAGPRYPQQRGRDDYQRGPVSTPTAAQRPSTPEPRWQAESARGRPFELGPSPSKPSASPGVLTAGAKVQLQKGLFAGKLGTVTGLAGDSAQVLLGLMTVRVPTVDLQVV